MLRQIIAEEIPGSPDFSASISDLPIDSFGLVVLRGRIETALGRSVSDATWERIETLNDILALSSVQEAATTSQTTVDGAAQPAREHAADGDGRIVGVLAPERAG